MVSAEGGNVAAVIIASSTHCQVTTRTGSVAPSNVVVVSNSPSVFREL